MIPRYFTIGLLGLLLVVSACDRVDDQATAPRDAQTTIQAEAASSPEPTLINSPTETDNPLITTVTALDLLPDASAPIDGDFRPDSYLIVGATGRPQVVELFSYG